MAGLNGVNIRLHQAQDRLLVHAFSKMMLTYGQAMFCPTGENKKIQVFMTWIFCGEARKRCVSVGKNAKKVRIYR